jgi:hypothetical protein
VDLLGGPRVSELSACPSTTGRRLSASWNGYGQRHSSGTVTIPTDCIEAVVHYTSRTPTHRHLREAFVVSIEPAKVPSE